MRYHDFVHIRVSFNALFQRSPFYRYGKTAVFFNWDTLNVVIVFVS